MLSDQYKNASCTVHVLELLQDFFGLSFDLLRKLMNGCDYDRVVRLKDKKKGLIK